MKIDKSILILTSFYECNSRVPFPFPTKERFFQLKKSSTLICRVPKMNQMKRLLHGLKFSKAITSTSHIQLSYKLHLCDKFVKAHQQFNHNMYSRYTVSIVFFSFLLSIQHRNFGPLSRLKAGNPPALPTENSLFYYLKF